MIRTAIVGTGGIAGARHVPALRAQAHRAGIVAALTGVPVAAVRRRRDLAVGGFLALREGGLREFHAAAHRLKRELLDDRRARRRGGPLAAALTTGRRRERLRAGDPSYLRHGEVSRRERPERPLSGMYGLLHPCTGPALPTRSPRGPAESSPVPLTKETS
ncbi:hypothetical protein ACIQJ4_07635 [Streptomyces filamentosus]|uniref:hypothetical protein n=1 Tax=Streptomyces filamentosus TaxID=67294 RepID=UPI0038213BCD